MGKKNDTEITPETAAIAPSSLAIDEMRAIGGALSTEPPKSIEEVMVEPGSLADKVAKEIDATATIPDAELPKAIEEWNAPPDSPLDGVPYVEPGEVVNPQADADRWLTVDLERGHGAIPHLAERGGMGEENPVIMVNEQIVSCPFFDPADGLYGGVNLGDVVAYYPPDVDHYWPATVVEIAVDASCRLAAFTRDGVAMIRVPHQSQREPGAASWAHRNETWTNLGRIAAERALGRGGSAYEETRQLVARREAQAARAAERETAERERAASLGIEVAELRRRRAQFDALKVGDEVRRDDGTVFTVTGIDEGEEG